MRFRFTEQDRNDNSARHRVAGDFYLNKLQDSVAALRRVVGLSAFCCAVFAASVRAAPGDLDPTFNPAGTLPGTLSRASGEDHTFPQKLRIQPDGKYLVGASHLLNALATAQSEFEVWRYNPDGSPDTSFAQSGRLRFSVNAVDLLDSFADMALLPDGRFVVAGTCNVNKLAGNDEDFCLVRFEANGSVDSTFGSGGVVTLPIGASVDILNTIALQPDGKIVAAGRCFSATFDYQTCVARFLANGTLDTNFATSGVFFQALSSEDLTQTIALDSNGDILIAGTCGTAAFVREFCITRFTSAGAPDSSFNSTGTRTIVFPGYDARSLAGLAIQPDGRIVVGVECGIAGGNTFCVAKLNATGTFASTFGNIAIGRLVFSGTPFVVNTPAAIRIQSDGKILMSGTCDNTFCVARIFDDGVLDTGFGVAGFTDFEIVSGPDVENSNGDIAVAGDGKIVMSGRCREPSTTVPQPRSQLCLARLEGGSASARQCKLDIDGDGRVFSTTDALIMSRAAARVTGSAIIGGITFPANATRNTWPLIRDYLVRQCGMSIAP